MIPVGIVLTILIVWMIDSAESNSIASLAKLECYHCGQETDANQHNCKHCGGELQ
jgi:rRNA maturation endonuclease Nob1